MRKPRRLFFRCFLLLACAYAATLGQEAEDLARNFPTLESRRLALAESIAQRTVLQETGDDVALVKLINRIGELHLKLYDLDAALAAANEAQQIATKFRGSENESLLVDTLAFSARVHILRDENKLAVPLLTTALDLSRKLKYRAGEAESQTQFGEAYFGLGDNPAAVQSNNEALVIWRELQNKRAEARTLTTQGAIYMVNDQGEQATAVLKAAEAICRELNDPIPLATTLVVLNFVAMRQGQWQNALGFLNEAQTLLIDKEAEPYLAGQVTMSFGLVYEAYGQLETARSYFQECIRHYRDGAHDKAAAIDASYKLGRVQASLRDYAGARAQIEQGLATAKEIEKNLYIGLGHEDLGRVWLEAGSYDQARLNFQSALSYFKVNTRPWARVQSYLGQTEYLLGNLASAGSAYQNALRVFQDKNILDYTNEAALCFGLGKLALHQGQLDQAEKYLKRSIDLTEQLRENAASKELRSSFLASVHDRYETYVEYLMARDSREPGRRFDVRAFEANEYGRARALLDSLSNYQRELRQPSNPNLLIEEEKLQRKEQELVDARIKLVSQGSSDEAMAKVDDELTQVRSTYETLQARINSSTKFTNLLRPKPLTYETIKDQVIDPDTSLVSYSLGTKNSFAWVLTRNGLRSYKLADKQTIQNAASQLLRLLKDPLISAEETQLQTAIDEVSRLVLEPLSDELRTSRLIVVADGILQYIPFQVLKSSLHANEPLISRFDIVHAPSASALAIVRQERANRRPGENLLVGFGDAVFSPDYAPKPKTNTALAMSRSDDLGLRKLPRLFNAKRELRAIGDLVGNKSAFYMEYAATRDNLLKTDLSQFRILHVVTHGVLDADQPELSGLFLSLVDANDQPLDGFVSLADIYKMRAPVDLVVLSACHTALGKELHGEGLIGLTRGFMYAGASSVVASLWKVDDAASAELMKHFYAYMLRDGMAPPAALRAAQNQIRSQPKWRSPYYWAGFTFQGDYDLNLRATPQMMSRNFQKLIAIVALSILLAAVGSWYLLRRRLRTKQQNSYSTSKR